MLIAHDLLLLLLDDESGKIGSGVFEPDKALAGAVLIDLATLGLVDINDKGRLVAAGTGKPGEDPVLRRGLDVVRELAGRKPSAALGPIAKGLRDQLADELIAAGILRREEHKVLGLFRTSRLPTDDSSHEASLRVRLVAVLSGEQEPDSHTAPLIALLHAMDVVTKVLDVPDKRAAKRRAKEIASGDWAVAAVRKAVQATQEAVYSAGAGGGGA